MEAQRMIRSELIDRLGQKRKSDPDYHEKDLARDIGIHKSTLSLFLKGERNLSRDTALSVLQRLSISKRKCNHVLRAMELDKGTRKITTNDHQPNITIGDEQEYASNPDLVILLHLLEANDFKMDYKWISKRLGCNPKQVPRYGRILERLNLIKVVGGKWVQTGKRIDATELFRNDNYKKFHAKIASRIKDAPKSNPLKRYSFNWTVCIDPKDVPKFAKEIKKMCKKFDQHQKVSKKKHVYSLFSAVTPMTFE